MALRMFTEDDTMKVYTVETFGLGGHWYLDSIHADQDDAEIALDELISMYGPEGYRTREGTVFFDVPKVDGEEGNHSKLKPLI